MRASRTDLWEPEGEIPLGYPASMRVESAEQSIVSISI